MAYLRQAHCKSIFKKRGYHQWDRTYFSDFEPVGQKVPVANPAQFFRDHGRDYYVCCADFKTKALVLAKSKEMDDIRRAPFFEEDLRLKADELLVIPFDQVATVAAEVAEDVAHITTVFLFQTTRCGSTLLTKALEASGVIHCVAESDFYTGFCQHVLSTKSMDGLLPTCHGSSLLSTKDEHEDDMEQLLDVLRHTTTLFNYTLFQEDNTKTVTCYKMRGQVSVVADFLQKALPEAKSVLLYRSLVGTLDSYTRMISGGTYWKYWLLTTLGLDSIESRKIAFMSASLPWEDPIFSSVPVHQGIVWFTACVWLELMQKAHELTKDDLQQYFKVVLRYEDLCRYKEQMVFKILDLLGIDCSGKDARQKVREAFGVNSQVGHIVASRGAKGGESWVGEWELGIISTTLHHANMDIKQSDFVLNGTLTEI